MASLGFQRCYVLLNVSFLLLLFLFLTTYNRSSPKHHPVHLIRNTQPTKGDDCKGFESPDDHESNCSHLSANNPCVPQGYIDYLDVFYCACGTRPFLGYALLLLWLLILFYVLGNTASQYFCSSLESLSRVLRLSPSIAGITLLSLGNGAPDVFSSIVSFMGSGNGEVGLSSVLGGALFVTSIVVGLISILAGDRSIYIDRCCFVRDVCFYVLVLCCLLVILISGSISLWGSLSFMSLYVVYVFLVSTVHGRRDDKDRELVVPLLVSVETQEVMPIEKEAAERHDNGDWKLRHFRFSSSVAYYFNWVLFLVEMPLYLPRRLTIPDVSEERWSKPFAVASVIFSPLLLATLWNSQRGEMASQESLTIYLFGGLVGMMLGIAASESTENSNPPRKCLFPWLAGGFLMSVIWAYITARELVSLLVSLGLILGISPSILGLTVLAWGNSIGDLMANVAMAINGGRSGAQIAISGCYAGPMFNALVGLGLSLVLSSWSVHPEPFKIPKDLALFETFGFLIGSLLWALVMLPRRDMKLDKVLGIGLLAIYFCFLSLRLSESLLLVHFGS